MKRAVALCRMSKALNELGNDRQEAAIREALTQRGIEVLPDAKRDVMSATKFRLYDRPGWLEARELVASGHADMIAVWHLDRLTRDNRDLEDVIDSGVTVTCVTGDVDLATDAGRMVARILVAVAKGETERKAARQKLANKQRASMGLPYKGGNRAFGYTADGMEIVPEEAEAIQWAAATILNGGTTGDVVAEWTKRGLASSRHSDSKHGMAFSRPGVRDLLTSPRYVSVLEFKGKVIGPGAWPAILDQQTHEALVSRLTEHGKSWGRRDGGGRAVTSLLSKIARCGVCGVDLHASSLRANRLVYTCRTGRHVNPPRERLDMEVTEAVLGMLTDPRFLSTVIPQEDVDLAGMQADIDALHQRRSVLASTFAQGLMDTATFQKVTGELTEQISSLQDELSAAVAGSTLTGLSVGTPEVVGQWAKLALVHRRAVIERFFEITALKKQVARHPWDPDKHVRIERKIR